MNKKSIIVIIALIIVIAASIGIFYAASHDIFGDKKIDNDTSKALGTKDCGFFFFIFHVSDNCFRNSYFC